MNAQKIAFEENFRELYEFAPCGYLSSLIDGTIVGANQTFLNWTGCSREELLQSKKLQDLITVPCRIFYETQCAPLLQMQGFVREIALDILRKDRDPLPVLVNSAKQDSHDGRPAFVRSIFFDATDRRQYELELLNARHDLLERVKTSTAELEREISEKRKAEASLKELTARLLMLRDEESRRLARDLHDSVGQLLAATTMNLNAISREAETFSPRAAKCLVEATDLVGEALKEIRVVSYLLHPPLLDESGLPSALNFYISGFSERGDVTVELNIDEEFGRLPQDMETAIFRMVQECLTNIHRHSGSPTATVKVVRADGVVHVEITDQGKGMSAQQSSGVGLRGMRERIGQFGGALEIRSTANGTSIQAFFPLSPLSPKPSPPI